MMRPRSAKESARVLPRQWLDETFGAHQGLGELRSIEYEPHFAQLGSLVCFRANASRACVWTAVSVMHSSSVSFTTTFKWQSRRWQ